MTRRATPRRVAAALALALLLVALVPPPAAQAAGPVSRGPIVILSDLQFTAANGVRSGTGTAADPFVISDWLIETGSGPAVRIWGTTAFVVIRDNVLAGGTNAPTLDLRDNAGRLVIQDNVLTHRGWGVYAIGGRLLVEGNAVRDAGSPSTYGAAVWAKAARVHVANSTFTQNDVAVQLTDSPEASVASLRVVAATEGVVVKGGYASVTNAEIQASGRAIAAEASATVAVTGGLLTSPQTGVWAKGAAVTASGLRVEGATRHAFLLDSSLSTLSAVEVVGGAQGARVVRGRADVTSSAFTAVLGTAVQYVDGTGEVSASTFVKTGGGVALDGASIVAVQGNVMTDNVWGLGIAYGSRASIALLSGNVVNGVAADGHFRWRDANLAFSGTFDNGFGAGYYGSIAREGTFVLYDVNGALFAGATISHGTVGVHAVNSINVGIEASLLEWNVCGVVFNGTIGYVKNSTIDVPIDPPLTCGVTVQGGVGIVANNTILRADFGVVVSGQARANVSGNLVAQTQVGVRLVGGTAYNVTVSGNVVTNNVVGLHVQGGFAGEVRNNTIQANARAGVHVSGATSFTFAGNVVVRNGRGVEDTTPCTAAGGARSRFENNVVANNTLYGVTLNGTVVMRGNVVVDNGGDGAVVCGRVEGRANVYARNGADGLEVRGSAQLEADAYVHQRFGAGLRLQGTLFVALYVNATANLDGIVVNEPLPLPPVTVPPIGPPTVPPPPRTPCLCPDPLWIHLSVIERNARWAIHATPWTDVNATANYWGGGAPSPWIPQYAEFGNVVDPNVRYAPWWTDRAMTQRAPV